MLIKFKKKIKFTLSIISILFFYIFGEEISWGQHIFEWESFGIFSNYNLQQETNIHNFFNPYFFVIYPLIGVGLFFPLFFIWFFSKRKTYFHQLFIPHQSLFFIVFAMAYTSFNSHNETYEILLSIFSFSYIIRVFICLNNPKLN